MVREVHTVRGSIFGARKNLVSRESREIWCNFKKKTEFKLLKISGKSETVKICYHDRHVTRIT